MLWQMILCMPEIKYQALRGNIASSQYYVHRCDNNSCGRKNRIFDMCLSLSILQNNYACTVTDNTTSSIWILLNHGALLATNFCTLPSATSWIWSPLPLRDRWIPSKLSHWIGRFPSERPAKLNNCTTSWDHHCLWDFHASLSKSMWLRLLLLNPFRLPNKRPKVTADGCDQIAPTERILLSDGSHFPAFNGL